MERYDEHSTFESIDYGAVFRLFWFKYVHGTETEFKFCCQFEVHEEEINAESKFVKHIKRMLIYRVIVVVVSDSFGVQIVAE